VTRERLGSAIIRPRQVYSVTVSAAWLRLEPSISFAPVPAMPLCSTPAATSAYAVHCNAASCGKR